jgi:hypothetical protein
VVIAPPMQPFDEQGQEKSLPHRVENPNGEFSWSIF